MNLHNDLGETHSMHAFQESWHYQSYSSRLFIASMQGVDGPDAEESG